MGRQNKFNSVESTSLNALSNHTCRTTTTTTLLKAQVASYALHDIHRCTSITTQSGKLVGKSPSIVSNAYRSDPFHSLRASWRDSALLSIVPFQGDAVMHDLRKIFMRA